MKGSEICRLLKTLGLPISDQQADQFEIFLALLLRWNDRLNLTAVRDSEEIVTRHFAESIQCSRAVPAEARTLLDYGSGAGFPGVPCAICLPEVRCTLSESQQKKAAFLQEVARKLELNATVHAGRVETLPPSLRFDAVTLRAVDRMEVACRDAVGRVNPGGSLLVMGGESLLDRLERLESVSERVFWSVSWSKRQLLSGSSSRFLQLGKRLDRRQP
jgi:16S rRNA (guanine527-N7)-methyltransferase